MAGAIASGRLSVIHGTGTVAEIFYLIHMKETDREREKKRE